MPPRKQPAKAVKQDEPKQETTQIEVKAEPKPTAIRIRPELYDRLMKIGDDEYWSRILENYYHDLAKRYRR